MKVIKIGASWCNGCLVMKPRWQKIEKDHPWLETEFFDFDENPEVIGKYKVTEERMPVFIFLDKDNTEIKRLSGEISESDIIELITELKDK
jgi:thiol-disulfide isomerase/thioredoxin